jgi:hypothetical protein
VDLWDYGYHNHHVEIFPCRKIKTSNVWITEGQDIWWVINSNSLSLKKKMLDMWHLETIQRER